MKFSILMKTFHFSERPRKYLPFKKKSEVNPIPHLGERALLRTREKNIFFPAFCSSRDPRFKEFPQSQANLLPEILKVFQKSVKKKIERRYLREKLVFFTLLFLMLNHI